MNYSLKGESIFITNTILDDIDKIIEFENLNSKFVHHYDKSKHIELLDDNDCFHFSIKKNQNEKLIGHMILFGGQSRHRILEFRRLTIIEKGFGFGREAIQILKRFCFEELKYHRLWLDVYDDNQIAINLYESEGFKLEGILRENIKTENGYRSQRIYSMLEDEYEISKN